MNRSTWLVLSVVAAAAGCASSASPSAETAEALTVGVRIDGVTSPQIVGASADRRRVAYAWPCSPDSQETPSLAVLDTWTGITAQLGPIARCMPNGVSFSNDGSLVVYPSADAVATVWSARTGAVVNVSRPDLRAIAVAFAPDSRWLVVASTGEPPTSFVDAWEADLVHHVEIGGNIFVNPFGSGNDAVKFSPDARRILYLGDAQAPYPVGALTEWDHATRRSRVLARGVAAYAVDDAWSRVAFLDGVTVASGPPSDWMHGRLAVERLGNGHVDVVEADAPATPQYFTPDGTLVYFVGPVGGIATGRELKLAPPGGAARTVDSGVFQTYGPTSSAALSPAGDALAYVTAFDPMTFSGELHVAALSPRAPAPTVVVRDVIPLGAFGWVDDTLGYLHASTATFPGAGVGTLGIWTRDGGTRDLATAVTQVGLRFDDAAGRIVYFDQWDAGRAAGNLRRYATTTGQSRLLARDAFAMSLSWSPDDSTAGVLTLGPSPQPGTPPRTTLVVAGADGPGGARTIARDVTSFVVADGGRVFYTTDGGLWAAVSF